MTHAELVFDDEDHTPGMSIKVGTPPSMGRGISRKSGRREVSVRIYVDT
jgi:hypothetical protein